MRSYGTNYLITNYSGDGVSPSKTQKYELLHNIFSLPTQYRPFSCGYTLKFPILAPFAVIRRLYGDILTRAKTPMGI